MARLRTDIWVAAYVRTCHARGAYAVVRRRGAAEAGALFIKIDYLDGTCALYGPAPQSMFEDDPARSDRQFVLMGAERAEPADIEARLAREMRFDTDLWIVEVEDREGRHGLDLVS